MICTQRLRASRRSLTRLETDETDEYSFSLSSRVTQGRHHKPLFDQVFHCQPNVPLHNKVEAMNLNRWICCLFVVIVVFVMAWKENVMAIVFVF